MKAILCSFACSVLVLAPRFIHAEEVDLEVVHRIKQEAFHNSRVMDYMNLIADENGPRMSGSPGYRRAAENAVKAFKAAGIKNAALEVWGTFGRGWDWTRVAVQMKKPQETTLTAYPADFSPATGQPVSGEVVFAPVWALESDAPENRDLVKLALQIEAWKEKYRGRLQGKIVMLDHPLKFKLPEEPETFRFSDEDLANFGHSGYNGPIDPGPIPELEWPLTAYPVDKGEASRVWEIMPLEYAADRWDLEYRINSRIGAFLVQEGALAVLVTLRLSRQP